MAGIHRAGVVVALLACGSCAPPAHHTTLDLSQVYKVTPDADTLITLNSNQQKTTFNVNGISIPGVGKRVAILVPNRPLTVTARPDCYTEKEDYFQPPFRDGSLFGFYFLNEDKAPCGVAVAAVAPAPPPAMRPIIPAAGLRPPNVVPGSVGRHPNFSSNGGRRVALVIGNGAYDAFGALRNPTNDAQLIASVLQQDGYTLIGGSAQINLSHDSFNQMLLEFGRSIPGAAVALFYYAGHGMEVDGENWLVPVDAELVNPREVSFRMISANQVLKQMSKVGPQLNIIFLDACRNNPFRSVSRGGTGGLAAMDAPKGTVIAFSTQPGSLAFDGSGKNSPYSAALASAMQQEDSELLHLLNRVGLEVQEETGGAQVPWLSSSPIPPGTQFRIPPGN